MLTKRKMQELVNEGYDLDFIERTKPQGGITFKNNFGVRAGDGHSATLNVYYLPTSVPHLWQTNLTDNLNTVGKHDYSTANKESVLRAINLTLSEFKDNAENERTYTKRNDAISEFVGLQEFAQKITQGGEIVKLARFRIHLSADTSEDLERQKQEIRAKLSSKNYKATVFLFEEKEEWQSLFESYSEQSTHFNSHEGIAIPATAIGGGYPFNHQYLIDRPAGGYVGVTETNGAFIFDPFQVTDTRTSFSGIGLGLSGSGKSTLLKLLEEMLVGRNCLIRGFEKNRDWYKLIKSQNGVIVDQSGHGEGGLINSLEVFATRTDSTGLHKDELGSYMKNRTKFFNQIRFLNPDMGNVDQLQFQEIFDAFYISKGLLEPNFMSHRERIEITGLPSTQYPMLEEFRDFYKNHTSQEKYRQSTSGEREAIRQFGTVLDSMCGSYGAIFNGHTTLKDFSNERVLFYDIEGISELDRPLFNCQLFTALTLNWSQATNNGRRMKNLLETKQIKPEEVRYFMFFMDECQNVINYENAFAVQYVVDFLKEMRKFSAGTYLATQSPQEMLPEGSSDLYISKVKQVFELCQTKILLHMDDSIIGRMREVLGTGLKESDYQAMRALKRGEALFNLGSGETYKVSVDPTKEQLERFAGGH